MRLIQIAYRDLKQENVLIDSDGYGIIVDLGFAKLVEDKTYTLCGTPEMLAPEIIMSKGHNHAVDYWAFGVVVYELLVGHSPFYIPGTSQIDMFKRIVRLQYEIPDYVNKHASTMVTRLLESNQSNRLGNLANGYLDVKRHPWFSDAGISFKDLLRKQVDAPWIPPVKDTRHHSSSHGGFGEYGRRLTKSEQEAFKGF